MSTAPSLTQLHVPPLYSGDQMTQPEFHRRYKAYPEDARFELIGGTVYMTSPLHRAHGCWHLQLGSLLERYANATPGVEALDKSSAGEAGGGRTHTFGVRNPAVKLRGKAVYQRRDVIIVDGKPVPRNGYDD